METLLGRYAPKFPFNYELHRNELNVALMNGSRVRGGEGRFITFYFIIFYTISFFIYKKNTKVINLPSPPLTLDPYLIIKR